MYPKIIYVSAIFISCNGFCIDKSENKRDVLNKYKLSDWTLFKNKHGGELKEFAPVAKKHVKKRLASPLNYKLVPAGDEPDDYFDKGGDDNNDENYESKDWSDLNRDAKGDKGKKAVIKIQDLSDIEGINAVKKQKEFYDIHSHTPKKFEKNEVPSYDGDEDEEAKDEIKNVKDPNPIISIISTTESIVKDKRKKSKNYDDTDYYDIIDKVKPQISNKTLQKLHEKKKPLYNDETNDYEDTQEKTKTDAEKVNEISENEAKKSKILDSVDDLKERHALESKIISERFKEEELQREEFERNNAYNANSRDKYRDSPHQRKKPFLDYDEYEDRSFTEKYLPHQVSKLITIKTTAATTRAPKTEYRKMSIFKSPQLYLSYDDEPTDTTIPPTSITLPLTNLPDDERISLIPEDSKEGEPTLFLPVKVKSKKRKKPNKIHKVTTMETSVVTTDKEYPTTDDKQNTAYTSTNTDRYTETTTDTNTGAYETTDYTTRGSVREIDMDGLGSDLNSVTTIDNYDGKSTFKGDYSEESTGPGDETTTQKIDLILEVHEDLASESSDHRSDAKRNKETGAGRAHESENSEYHNENGKKGFETYDQQNVKAKGYHDVRKDVNKYDTHNDAKDVHEEDSGHHASHKHEERGKKYAEYEEVGKHSKGHSTKGSHDVHKKEEYEKKAEFFEEDGSEEEDVKKKENGHTLSGRTKQRHAHYVRPLRTHPAAVITKPRQYEKRRAVPKIQPPTHNEEKKWIYHQGYPARSGNLLVIDRRLGLNRGRQYG